MKPFVKLLSLTAALVLLIGCLPVFSAAAADNAAALSVRFVDEAGNVITETLANTTVSAQIILSGDVQTVQAASLYLSANAAFGEVTADGFDEAESAEHADGVLAVALYASEGVALSGGVLCSVKISVGSDPVSVSLVETVGEVSTGVADADDASLPLDALTGATLNIGTSAPGFAGAQLVLSSSIGINFYVKDEALALVGATRSYAKINFDVDRDGILDEVILKPSSTTVSGIPCQRYFFNGIAPDNMGQPITAQLMYVDDEGEHEGLALTYSVTQYITNTLTSMEKYPSSYQNPKGLSTLLADLLAYGRASEAYTGKSSITMSTALETLLGKASTGTVANTAASNKKALYYAPGLSAATASVQWTSVGLNLRDNAAILYLFKPADGKSVSDYTLKLEVDGKTYSASVSEANYEESYGAYAYRFRELGPCDMGKTVRAYFVDRDGKVASGYLQYSVESYAYACYQNRTSKPVLNDLTQALIRYGNSAKAYFSAS